MSRFDLHRKHPSACLHAVGPDASSTRTLLLSLSTIAGTKISNPPWVNFQSAGWVSFQSAPTIYMIFGLSQTLPDVVLKWIGIGIDSMGSTQATNEMRSNTEKFGPSNLGGGGGGKKPIPGGGSSGLQHEGGDGGGGRGGQNGAPKLLSSGPQGVVPSGDADDGPNGFGGGSFYSETPPKPSGRDSNANNNKPIIT